mmetsp:Transcript_30203/g.97473  ORF Transcript_30203/g.97473 Transcript_30203/m.97473 type:complete len:414 (-) Transcript_30203:639-1880(-)
MQSVARMEEVSMALLMPTPAGTSLLSACSQKISRKSSSTSSSRKRSTRTRKGMLPTRPCSASLRQTLPRNWSSSRAWRRPRRGCLASTRKKSKSQLLYPYSVACLTSGLSNTLMGICGCCASVCCMLRARKWRITGSWWFSMSEKASTLKRTGAAGWSADANWSSRRNSAMWAVSCSSKSVSRQPRLSSTRTTEAASLGLASAAASASSRAAPPPSGSSGMACSSSAKCDQSDASRSNAWPRAGGGACGWRATCRARCSRYSSPPDLAMYPCMPLVAARSGTSSAAKAKNSTGVGRCCGSTAERNWLRWSPLKCSTIGRSAPAACSSGWARHASVSAEVPPAGRENHGQSASCSPRAVSSDARRQRSLLVQRATSASVEHSPSRSAPSASSHAAPSRSHSPARWRQWAKASLR